MTKQEFLAFSLPYELHGITANRVALINGVEYEMELPIIWRGEKFSGRCGFGIMPIVRPLSDLTKEIEHKGEKFVPVNRLKNFFGWDYLWSCHKKRETINPYAIPYACFSKLIEWHFDLFGGIDNGEAIDVNTLTENPYK